MADVANVMTKLLQAQVDSIAAQARASAMQNLPSIPFYTGDVMEEGLNDGSSVLRKGLKLLDGVLKNVSIN